MSVPYCARTRLTLVVLLFFISAGLTWLMPGYSTARSTFQSPPPEAGLFQAETSPLPLPTVAPFPPPTFPPVTFPGAAPAIQVSPILPAQVPAAEPAAMNAALPAEVAPGPGYLPPPTLTAPGAFAGGQAARLLASGQAPLSAPPVAREAVPLSTIETAPGLDIAQLIDDIIVAFSYVWLFCGAFLMLLVALFVVWLMRRSRAS